MNEYIRLFWPEIMYQYTKAGISSYYKTGLKDNYSWSGVQLE